MPSGGEDGAAPPIRVWAAAARANLAVLVHGANYYSMGAGGFSQCPALPAMVRLRQPANPQTHSQLRQSETYVTQPTTFKQRLESQFGKI